MAPGHNSMKKLSIVLLMLCFVRAAFCSEPELKTVLKYFSNVTAAPGRITATIDPNGVRILYVKDDSVGVLLEKGETISLTPGFEEVRFVERHACISIKRVGSGNVYEVRSAFDASSFGGELEEEKYTLLFSETEFEFKEGSPSVDKGVETKTANKKHDSPLRSVLSSSGGIKESQATVSSGKPSILVREQVFPWLWIVSAVLIAASGLLWRLLKRRK